MNFTVLLGNEAFIEYEMTACAKTKTFTWRVQGKELQTPLKFAENPAQTLMIKETEISNYGEGSTSGQNCAIVDQIVTVTSELPPLADPTHDPIPQLRITTNSRLSR